MDYMGCSICDPAVDRIRDLRLSDSFSRGEIFSVGQRKFRDIPKLVAEVAVTLDTSNVESHVPTGGRECAKSESKRIAAVFRNSIREFFDGPRFDLFRHLRLSKICCPFLNEFF